MLEPVSAAQPCGRNLDYTPELMLLEESVKEPDEPGLKDIEAIDSRNWRDILNKSDKLLRESKDLRVAVIMTRALLHVDGFAGYCSGLSVVKGIVEQYWDGLYPALEEGDPDPIMRLNALRELWNTPTMNELRGAVLVSVRGLGDFSLNDFLIAKGLAKPRTGVTPPSPQHVLRGFETGATPELMAQARGGLDDVKALESMVRTKANDHGFETAPLREIFGRAVTGLSEFVRATVAAGEAGAPSADQGDGAGAVAEMRSVPMAIAGEVQSRDDVMKMLDKIVTYYEKNEPSSPVPLLMQRARRLVTMNFMEIMKDLADKGLPQVEAVSGKETKA
ncbi:MAG TPA: type VI secretion system protein TssA [Polyangiales bacterium]|nr:type VI secretion system protein TssA [Polyangiales bacterium]